MDWLLIFTFSPVQGFVRASKKTKDLFAGSYLLSFFTYKAIKAFQETATREDRVIYPVVDKDIKHFHQLLMGNYPNRFVALLKNKTPQEVKNLISSLRERFKCELRKIVEETRNDLIENSLNGLDQYRCKIDNIQNLLGAKEQIPIHIKDYFQVFITAREVKDLDARYKEEYEKAEKLLGGRKTFRPYRGLVDNAAYLKKEEKREKKEMKYLFPNGCTTCGEQLFLAIDWEKAKLTDVAESEKLCGLCYAKRRLADIYLLKDNDIDCFLNKVSSKEKKSYEELKEELELSFKRFPSTHDIALAVEKYQFFIDLAENLNTSDETLKEFLSLLLKVLILFRDSGSISYGINTYWREKLRKKVSKKWKKLLKELLTDEYILTDECFLEKYESILKNPWMISVEFLSTNEIANLEKLLLKKKKQEKTKDIELQQKYLDEYKRYLQKIFKILKEKTGKDYEQIFNRPPYFGIIFSDGDNIGKILGGDENILREDKKFNLEFHTEFSKKLSEYATSVAKELEEGEKEHKPGFIKVVYAGGDDIFAFVHPLEVIRTLRTTSERYRKILEGLLREEKATTSAGVVIGHAKVSLKYLLKKTYEGESEAKNSFGRNAFVIKVISRSGEETTFGSKYRYKNVKDPLNLLEKLSEYYANDKISSKLPYALRELADRYFSPSREEKNSNSQEEVLKEEREKFEIAKILLKRELLRKVNLDNEQEKETLIKDIENFFEQQFEEHTLEPLRGENKRNQKPLLVGDLLKNLAGMFYVARTLSGWVENERAYKTA